MINVGRIAPNEVHLRIGALLEQGKALDGEARARIVELGAQATPGLLEILANRALWDDQAAGQGFAPIYAAEILGEIGDPNALDTLYGVFRDVEPDMLLDDALTGAICAFGQAAVPAGMRALRSWDDPFLASLAYLFSGLHVSELHASLSPGAALLTSAEPPDPALHRKVLQVLLKYFLKEPIPGAEYLADFGDPIAIDALTVAMDRYIATASGDSKYHRPLLAIAEAITALGGILSATQQHAIDHLKPHRTSSEETLAKLHAKPAADESLTFKNARNLGRNDACWCGSGRKYKQCHLQTDLMETPDNAE